jgi:hypothetical protein
MAVVAEEKANLANCVLMIVLIYVMVIRMVIGLKTRQTCFIVPVSNRNRLRMLNGKKMITEYLEIENNS